MIRNRAASSDARQAEVARAILVPMIAAQPKALTRPPARHRTRVRKRPRSPAVRIRAPSPRRLAHPRARSGEITTHRRRQRRRIVRRHQHAGLAAVQGFLHAAPTARGDDGQPSRHRFEHRDRHALEA
jgi:hypothetical protein